MVLVGDLSAMLNAFQGPGSRCRRLSSADSMSSIPLPHASNHRGCFNRHISCSRPGRIRWRGVYARPVYAVSRRNVLLVGTEAIGSEQAPACPLDRLNAEVTTLIALKQHEHSACETAFATLLRDRQPIELWQVDIRRTQSRLIKHYFAQIDRRLVVTNVAPSSVVSFVIQTRERAETS